MIIQSETLSLLVNCAVLGVMLLGTILIVMLFLGLMASYYFKRQTAELARLAATQEKKYMALIKAQRAAKAKEALVPDAPAALAWVLGQINPTLAQPVEALDSPHALPDLQAVELLAQDGRRVLVTPLSAGALRRAGTVRGAALQQPTYAALLKTTRGWESVVRSLLDADYFDLEAAQAGARLGAEWNDLHQLWFHILPPLSGPASA